MIGGAAVHGLRCGVVIGDATEALMQSAVLRPPNHLSPEQNENNLLRHTNILVCAAIGKKIYVLYVGISACKGLLYFSERK